VPTCSRKHDRSAKEMKAGVKTVLSPVVVGIGASAGGLEAVSELLKNLPPDTGMTFIVVQHLDPTHHSALPEILQRQTAMKVTEATEAVHIDPNHVYVIPPDKTLRIFHDKLLLEPRGETKKPHMAIDLFFRSLAEDRRHRAIGVILSGTGNDGTKGLRAIKEEGGLTFAQDEKTAKYTAMPLNAVDEGAVDFIHPPREIARELVRISKESPKVFSDMERAGEHFAGTEQAQHNLFSIMRNSTHVDFSIYKPGMVNRRIARRMLLKRIDTLSEYVECLRETPQEVRALFDDLLIGVTSFFRDPELYHAVETGVVPAMLKDDGKKALRIWVPGCSTGEEPYSLCMSILELMEREDMHLPVQVFATDIWEPAIENARMGIYADGAVSDVSPERLQRFFHRVDGRWQINKQIRDMCIFSLHNLTRDPPFSNIDILSCRNLLIYLNQQVQQKVLNSFHYALRPHGYLILGSSESAGAATQLFDNFNKKLRIYTRKPGPAQFGADKYRNLRAERTETGKSLDKRQETYDVTREVEKLLLKKHVSASFLINAQQEIQELYGDVRWVLEPAAGTVKLSLGRMINPALMPELHTLLAEVKRTGRPARKREAFVDMDGEGKRVGMEVVPMRAEPLVEPEHLLVIIRDLGEMALCRIPEGDVPPLESEKDAMIEQLRNELAATRVNLQSVIEEQETTNEELRSTFEELQSNNEELQSTNEEMETAREELQSTNQELITLNDELQEKNLELNKVNNDMGNILASIKIPVVILDMELRVRRITPSAETALGLIPGDVGRPFSDVRFAAERGVLDVIRDTLESLSGRSIEIHGRDDRWYTLKVRPYRSHDNRIDGVVLVMIDIDDARKACHTEETVRQYAEAIVETVREPLIILGGDFRVRNANRAFCAAFEVRPEETAGQHIYHLQEGRWDTPRLRELLEEVLPQRGEVENFTIEAEFPGHGRIVLKLNARRIGEQEGIEALTLLAMELKKRRKRNSP
jgi:two-component system CheB/CheR fusion protein